MILSTLGPAMIASSRAAFSQAAVAPQGLPTASAVQLHGTSKVSPGPVLQGRVFAGALSTSQRLGQLRASTHFTGSPSPSQIPGLTLGKGNYRYVTLKIPRATTIMPGAINDADMVVGSCDDEQGLPHGFLWTDGTTQVIDYPGAANTTNFTGINNRGELLAQIFNSNTRQSFTALYFVATSTWSPLPEIPGGGSSVSAVGLTDEGLVVGCPTPGYIGSLSWIWHPDTETYSYFTAPAASEATTCAEAVSFSGDVVGSFTPAYSVFSNATIFIRTSQGQFETIFSPSSSLLLSTTEINDSDTIAGLLYTPTLTVAFVRTSTGVFTVVNQPGFTSSFIDGLNDSGVLCGTGYNLNNNDTSAFIAYPQ